MSKRLTDEQKTAIITRYQLAYEAANPGKRIRVTLSSPGWYTLVSGFGRNGKYRIRQLESMAERLEERVKRQGETQVGQSQTGYAT